MNFKIANLLSSESTNGMMAAFEEVTTPGGGPPLHVHHDQLEVFHVIKGRHRFVVDGLETVAEAGACLVVPMGAAHAFQNISAEEGILHFELLPAGGSEEFFRKLVAGDFDSADVAGFFQTHGIDLVGPPLG
jgi:quercetin dioxygenase-like cupin family protein